MRALIIVSLLLLSGCRSHQDNLLARPPSYPYTAVQAFPRLSFVRPVDLQTARDGTGRLFVVEQGGVIRVFKNDPAVAKADVFLDIKARVKAQHNEEGLLGLAFHPDYKKNGLFYVSYTAPNPSRNRISRFKVSDNPQVADPNSEEIVIEVPDPYGNHNGGQVAFGPDGMLYIAWGDGGAGGDPQGHAQNLNSLLGKILRIDVSKSPYTIPPDNPFAGQPGKRGEVWAYGLRNPWRFSFDSKSGEMWTGDVGQNAVEEIDIVRKGGNYGWNLKEGTRTFKPSKPMPTDLIDPVWEYPRGLGQCVTGGYVYRGPSRRELVGAYICADYLSRRLWALRRIGDRVDAEVLTTDAPMIASFGVDDQNELYMCDFDGHITRIERTP